MTPAIWFDDLPVLGALPPEVAAAKLREIGETEAAAALEEAAMAVQKTVVYGTWAAWWPFWDKPWQHTAHTFGYLAPALASTRPRHIQHASAIAADASLKHARIKITLDHLHVAAYPGGGTHRVLFDFYAQHQVPGTVVPLHFTATFRVREGEHAAAIGYPIFVGLNVGTEGLAFKCFTVNIKNDEDEAFLGFLESDAFRAGLKLTTSLQPAVGLLSETVLALTRAVARRHCNVPVQDFYLGLDFTPISTRARLAEGSYLAVQIPETLQTVWRWNEWIYDPITGRVINREHPSQLIPYNYLIFSVSRYEEG